MVPAMKESSRADRHHTIPTKDHKIYHNRKSQQRLVGAADVPWQEGPLQFSNEQDPPGQDGPSMQLEYEHPPPWKSVQVCNKAWFELSAFDLW